MLWVNMPKGWGRLSGIPGVSMLNEFAGVGRASTGDGDGAMGFTVGSGGVSGREKSECTEESDDPDAIDEVEHAEEDDECLR